MLDHPEMVPARRKAVAERDRAERAILEGTTVSRRKNMNRYFKHKRDVVRFVADQLPSSIRDSQLTITIKPAKYEGFSVSIVIDMLSGDIGKDVS